jgi:hypothetical protein
MILHFDCFILRQDLQNEKSRLASLLVQQRRAEIDARVELDHLTNLFRITLCHNALSQESYMMIDKLDRSVDHSRKLHASVSQQRSKLRQTLNYVGRLRSRFEVLRHSSFNDVLECKGDLHSVAGVLVLFSQNNVNEDRQKNDQDFLARDFLVSSLFPKMIHSEKRRLPKLEETHEILTTRLRRIESPAECIFRILIRMKYRKLCQTIHHLRKFSKERKSCLGNFSIFLTKKLKASTTLKAYKRIAGTEDIRGSFRTSLFVKALKDLGYPGDAVTVGAAIDSDQSGSVTYAKFFRAMCTFK